MKRIGLFLLAVVMVGIVGCSSYQQYYQYVSGATPELVKERLILLKTGESPAIYTSNDLMRDVRDLRSKNYTDYGYSSFNGKYESQDMVVEQARRIGATVVLVQSKHTGSSSSTVPLFLPNSTTTTHSGVVTGYGGSAIYSGNSRTSGTMVVPITVNHERYDQIAVFFAKEKIKPTIGIAVINLPPDLRVILERNNGAVIDMVLEDSPAFAANILPGDILLEVNGIPVRNAEHFPEIVKEIRNNHDRSCILKIIRNGTEKEIVLHLIRA